MDQEMPAPLGQFYYLQAAIKGDSLTKYSANLHELVKFHLKIINK